MKGSKLDISNGSRKDQIYRTGRDVSRRYVHERKKRINNWAMPYKTTGVFLLADVSRNAPVVVLGSIEETRWRLVAWPNCLKILPSFTQTLKVNVFMLLPPHDANGWQKTRKPLWWCTTVLKVSFDFLQGIPPNAAGAQPTLLLWSRQRGEKTSQDAWRLRRSLPFSPPLN